ncbi:MAG TPA: transglycosylase SLT domain-containing protein [Scandinavium sp.]|jgi:hypothetical protein|uniref:transglycosylase SLT domain-containing protein n=1 Tax=Scandinavium sp. TaxID=2830653 RepID=UPI002E3708C7|nr:transglycosylase SLT domain-containing protein [Scandinavium sp.]HEX4500619.1 transglycosylase SLT domain-containing protein [Scandinavium sp.]
MPDDDYIAQNAGRTDIPESWLRKIMAVESGGNPNAQTGSYHGLFQLSHSEFRAGGGTGDIYDPQQNTRAAANKIAQEKQTFERKHGRPATLPDIYMIHQQGAAGYDAHLANPDAPAWQNEQRASGKSASWAKTAIWGNMTPAMKAKYGSVENVTSGDFTGDWSRKVEGQAPSTAMTRSRARHEAIPTEAGTAPEGAPAPKPVPELDISTGPDVEPVEIRPVARFRMRKSPYLASIPSGGNGA